MHPLCVQCCQLTSSGCPLYLTEYLHASSVCTVLSADIKWVPLVLTESLHHASSVCTVLSADMKWVPLGDQASRLEDVRPVLDDIVIAKLRPGQVRIHTCMYM